MTLLTNKQFLLFTLIHLSHWFLKENVKSNLKMSKCVEVQACLMPIFTEMTRGWVNMSIWNEVLQNYLFKKKPHTSPPVGWFQSCDALRHICLSELVHLTVTSSCLQQYNLWRLLSALIGLTGLMALSLRLCTNTHLV